MKSAPLTLEELSAADWSAKVLALPDDQQAEACATKIVKDESFPSRMLEALAVHRALFAKILLEPGDADAIVVAAGRLRSTPAEHLPPTGCNKTVASILKFLRVDPQTNSN